MIHVDQSSQGQLVVVSLSHRYPEQMASEIMTDIASNVSTKRSQQGAETMECSRDVFQNHVLNILRQWSYALESSALKDILVDFNTACSLVQKEASVFVLIAGTSGTGKSTLASLIAGLSESKNRALFYPRPQGKGLLTCVYKVCT